MKLNLMAAAVVSAVILVGSALTVSAQSSPITQSQFDSSTSGPFAVKWGIDSSLVFTTNGVLSNFESAGAYGYANVNVWNVNITFENGIGTMSAVNNAFPGMSWQYQGPISSSGSITSLYLALGSDSINDEGMSISSITENGGAPVNGSLSVDENQSFDGISIYNSSGLVSLDYTLTVDVPDLSVYDQIDSSDLPIVWNAITFPGIEATPEPSTTALAGVSLLCVFAGLLRKK